MKIEIGDLVALKSGGRPMTVASIKNDEAYCFWENTKGENVSKHFPIIVLKKIDPDEEPPMPIMG